MDSIFFVSSTGGHYHQLLACAENINHRLETIIVSPAVIGKSGFREIRIKDTNAKDVMGVIGCFYTMMTLLLKHRPKIILSTGAAPGGIAIFLGKLFGVRTIWIDSMANMNQPSLSGKLVRNIADVWISQSDSVAKENGGKYFGKVFDIY